MILRLLLCLMLTASMAQAQTAANAVAKVNAGTAVKIVIIGDSTGEGFSALWTHPPNDPTYDILRPKLQTSNPGANKLQTTPTNYRTDDLSPLSSWAMQLRSFIKGKNAASVVDNESASGWTSADHLRGHSGAQGTYQTNYSEDTLALTLAMSPQPDMAIIALGINDWNNPGLVSLSQFQNNISLMTNALCAAGIPVMLVKENDIDLTGLGHSGDPNSSGFYPYMDTAAAAANATYPGCVVVADFYTPTHNAIVANGGYSADRALGPTTTSNCTNTVSSCVQNVMYDQFHPDQHGSNLMAAAAIAAFNPPATARLSPTRTGQRLHLTRSGQRLAVTR